jgi:hypothetical protein
MKSFLYVSFIATIIFYGCVNSPATSDRLAKASRQNKNGWIYVHLEGSPSEIGYQHGYLLANAIDTSIQAVAYLLEHDTHRNWEFYRGAARNFLWPKLDQEYKDEINGIVEGLHAQKKNYDLISQPITQWKNLPIIMCQCLTI